MAAGGIVNIVPTMMTENNSGPLYVEAVFRLIHSYLTSSLARDKGVYCVGPGNIHQTGLDPHFVNPTAVIFKFISASCPFNMQLQYFTSSVSAPIRTDGDSKWSQYGGLGLSFWNSTSNLLDVTSSASTQYIWPRWNSISGTFSSSLKDYGVVSSFYHNPNQRNYSFIIDENNVLFVVSTLTGTTASPQTENVVWFGKYDQYSSSYDVTSQFSASCPYAMVAFQNADGAPGNLAVWPQGTSLYGSAAGVYGSIGDTQRAQGGIAHPDPSKGVVGLNVDSLSLMFNGSDSNNFHPNTLFPDRSYDALPVMLYMNEQSPTTGSMALLGQTSFVKFVNGLVSSDTTPDKRFAICGRATLMSNSGSLLMIPWDGITTPFTSSGTGSIF